VVLGLEELAAAAVVLAGPAASRLSFAVELASISDEEKVTEKRGDESRGISRKVAGEKRAPEVDP
jgi:hypothetical protein